MSDDYLIGRMCRVTVPITADMPGEVMLEIRGGYEAYTAYAGSGEELKKNTHAVVMEQTGNRTVMVTATQA